MENLNLEFSTDFNLKYIDNLSVTFAPTDNIEFCTELKKIAERFHQYLASVESMRRMQPSKGYLIIKRCIDILVGIIGLLLLSPIFLVMAIAIKLDSSGPVFFSQKRVGKNGKMFMIHKFRTMVKDAEAKTGPIWAKNEDPRITKVGKFLRKTKLDELPQLWNLLKGQMTLVGPRPERPEFTEQFVQIIPAFARRLDVTQGITGLAQLRNGYDDCPISIYKKLRFDVKYMKVMSLSVDIRLLMETIRAVLLRRT